MCALLLEPLYQTCEVSNSEHRGSGQAFCTLIYDLQPLTFAD